MSLDRPVGGGHARFICFLLTSGLAAGVNVLARYLLEFAMSYPMAVAVAYVIGMLTAFVLARHFVFAAGSHSSHSQFLRFALVNVVSFAQVWVVSVGLAQLLFPAIQLEWHAETIAHVIGVGSPAVTSYLLHQHFSFREARA